MDARETARKELLLRENDRLMPGKDVLKDVTRDLTEREWDRIEEELKRAIR